LETLNDNKVFNIASETWERPSELNSKIIYVVRTRSCINLDLTKFVRKF
jgi:hypothetical protein